jgi:hypothetical protein
MGILAPSALRLHEGGGSDSKKFSHAKTQWRKEKPQRRIDQPLRFLCAFASLREKTSSGGQAVPSD